MTKNKRFSHEYEKDGNYIFDGEVGQSFYYGFCFMDSDKCSLDDDVNSLVDLLNKLNDENEQLKQKYRKLQIDFNDACGIVHDLRESKLDLEDENEELKKGKWQCRLCGFTGTIEHICRKRGDVE